MPRNEVNSSSSNNPSMRHLNHNKVNEKIVCVIRARSTAAAAKVQ